MASSRPRLFLHLGMPKSGTTYLQEKLWLNQDVLRDAGVWYPGTIRGAHFHAMVDLRGIKWHGFDNPRVPGAWQRLVDHAREGDGTVVLSHEGLTMAKPEHVERAMADLDWAEVHLLCTARDLARQVPAMWQEHTKNRGTLTYTAFVDQLRTTEPGAGGYWRYGGPPSVLRLWAEHLPAERVHVVTIPPPGAAPDTLWARFAETVGLDPAVETAEPALNNPSMGVVETNLMRLLNTKMTGVAWPVFGPLLKEYLAIDVFARRPGTVKLELPAEDHSWVMQRSKEIVGDLRDAGYRVTGDLDDLVPRLDAAAKQDSRHPDQVSPEELLDAVSDGLAGMAGRIRQDLDRDRLTETQATDLAVGALADLVKRTGRRGAPRPAARPKPAADAAPAKQTASPGGSPSTTAELRRTFRYLSEHHPTWKWLRLKYHTAQRFATTALRRR